MSESLEEAIQLAIWGELSGKLHTAIPGRVNYYDYTKPSVEVKPMVKKVYYNGDEVSFPAIVSVPVLFPRTANFHLSFPIEKDDMVLLIFTERSMEEFLQTNQESAPQNARVFSLTDAVAIPGLFGFKKGSQISSSSKMELVFKDTQIVSDGSKVQIEADTIELNGSASFAMKYDEFKTMLDQFQTITAAGILAAGPGGPAAKTVYDAAYTAMLTMITAIKSTKNKLG